MVGYPFIHDDDDAAAVEEKKREPDGTVESIHPSTYATIMEFKKWRTIVGRD